MTVLFAPWADLVPFLRQAVTQMDREAGSFLPLWFFGLLLFVSVCLLLLQLIIYFVWKLRQADADLAEHSQVRSAIYRQTNRHVHLRRRRSVDSHSHT